MSDSLSFQLLSDRVVRQRILIETQSQKMKNHQKDQQHSIHLEELCPIHQPHKEHAYTNKTISHKLLPLLVKHAQTKSKEPDLIRNDIFLIRAKVNKITVQNKTLKDIIKKKEFDQINHKLNQLKLQADNINQKLNSSNQTPEESLNRENLHKQLKESLDLWKQVQNYALQNLINGKVRFRIIQKNPFYISPDQFQQKFQKQLKPIQPSFIDRIQAPNPDQLFRPINNRIQKLTNLVVQNFQEQNNQMKKKVKRINPMSKISKQTLFRMILSSFQSSNSNQKLQKPFNLYQQNYELPYKRQIIAQKKEKTHISEEQDQNNIEQIEKQTENKLILQSRPNLNNLFQKDDSLMFAGTQEGFFEIKFEELQLRETVNHFKQQKTQNLPGFNVFWANFRLKNFSQIPFTQHLITIKLDHKVQNRQNQQKKIDKEDKIKFIVDLSLYLVPGNKNGWGVLKIDETTVNWKDFIGQNKQRRLLKLKIQFPDVIQRNMRLIKSEQSQVETKIQSLDHGENPIWTEDIFIRINPQRNKFRIMLIEMEQNRFDVKQIVAERTLFLLEEGFLFDKVQSTRHILLKSHVGSGQEQQKTADLIISYCFEISINDQIVPEKSFSDKSNSFINRFGAFQ